MHGSEYLVLCLQSKVVWAMHALSMAPICKSWWREERDCWPRQEREGLQLQIESLIICINSPPVQPFPTALQPMFNSWESAWRTQGACGWSNQAKVGMSYTINVLVFELSNTCETDCDHQAFALLLWRAWLLAPHNLILIHREKNEAQKSTSFFRALFDELEDVGWDNVADLNEVCEMGR